MPLALKIIGRLFTPEQLTSPRSAFWPYLGPVPLLLCYYHANQGYFILNPRDLFQPGLQIYTLITLGMLMLVALFLALTIRGELEQVQKMSQLKEQNLQLQGRLNDINSYAVSLRKEQQELAILRHDSRHQLRMLAELAENGEFEEAEKHLLKLAERGGGQVTPILETTAVSLVYILCSSPSICWRFCPSGDFWRKKRKSPSAGPGWSWRWRKRP